MKANEEREERIRFVSILPSKSEIGGDNKKANQ